MKTEPKIVTKPWGSEAWISLTPHYCFKRIVLNAKKRTSLQVHKEKHETNYIVEGTIRLTYGKALNALTEIRMEAGSSFVIEPGTIHRVTAVTDVVMMEVSTPQVDDVVRITDDTDRPDGRIDSEHNP